MAGSYHAGTGVVDVLPSLKGFHTKIRSELKAINPDFAVNVKPNLSGFQRQMRAGLGKAGGTVQVKVTADTAALKKAEAEVTAAEKRMASAKDSTSDASARLDIAEKQLAETRQRSGAKASQIAAAELRVAQAKRAAAAATNEASNAESALSSARRAVRDIKIQMQADADTKPAAAKLQAFAARAGRAYAIKIGVDADTTGARMALQAFAVTAKRAASVTGNVTLDTGAAITKLTLLGAAGAGIGAGIAGGVGVAGAALVSLPSLVAAVLGPVAALTVGLNGVGDALSAFDDMQDQAAAGATNLAQQQTAAARQIATAQRQVVQAQTALARAYEDAEWAATASARQVRDAERQLVQAQKQRLQVQQELTKAVEDARRAQQSLNFEVRGGALAERQAVLDLADAQEALDAARANGTTGEDLERLEIAYEQQKLSLEQIRAENQNLQADQAAAAKAGIDGSDQVVAAKERIAQANDAVMQAEQGVAEARESARQQEIQSQRSIADAQAAVAQAQIQLTQAIADAGDVGAGATDKVNAAMAKLSPNAQQFVRTIQALKPEFAALKNETQDALFANLGPEFATFTGTVLPEMTKNLTVVAAAINLVAIQMMRFLATAPVVDAMQQLFAGIGQIITASAPVLQAFVMLFLQLATAAMPGILALVQAVGTLATVLLQALQPLIDTGQIGQAITVVAQLVTALAPILAQVVVVAVQLMNALGPSLIATVQALAPVFAVLAQLLVQIAPIVGQVAQMVAAALLPVFQALAPVIAAVLPVLAQLIGAGLQILVPLVQAAAQVLLALMPAVDGVLGAVMPLVPVIVSVIQAVAPLIAQLATQLAPILTQVAQLIVGVFASALTGLLPILPALVSVVSSLVNILSPLFPLLAQIAGQVMAAVMPALVALAPIFTTLIAAILPILPPLVNLVMTLLPILVGFIQTLMPMITLLAEIFGGLLAVVLSTIVVPIINLVVNAVKILADIFGFMWSIVRPIWEAFGAAAKWAYDNMLKPAFDKIREAVDAVGGWFQRMGDTVGGIWDGLKKLVHGGIQGIVDIVYNNGIRALANAVIKYIPGVDYLPEIKVPEFATGGRVSGPGTGTSDSIPALLSNGEFVVNAVGTERWLWLLEAINAGRFAKGGLVGFADGGAVAAAPAGSSASAVTVDPSALSPLGDAADVVTASVTALANAITTQLVPALQALMATNAQAIVSEQQLDAQFVLSADTMTNRQLLLQQQMAVSWAAITNTTWQAVNGQNQALVALENGMAAARAAMTNTANWAVTEYGRMRAAAADPVRWVLQFPFNAGLIAAWNRLDADFALGKPIAPVAIPFATGGFVSGPGTGTSDSIPARLSNGEFVVRERITKRVLPFLQALNSGQAEALQAAGYAQGGLVADTGSQLNAAIARGLAFAKAQDGKPYIWGGVGPEGFDCSGLMSAVTNVLRGEANPYRRLGVAASVPWPGFVPGLSSAFAMGASPSHTAGTLAGVNIESTGTHVRFGGDAHGADSGQFPVKASLPVVGGQFVPGGAGGFDPAAMVGPYFADTYRMIGQVATLFAVNVMAGQAAGVATQATDRVKGKGIEALNSLLATTAVAGSPEVVAAVRAVAARYGWGDGPEWTALFNLIAGESSWNPNAANPISSARGLFQKMTSLHGPLEPTIAGQAEWGLSYIKRAYGSPSIAYAKWLSRSPHWYHTGGWVPGLRGTDVPAVLTPGERVLSVAETRGLDSFIAGASRGGYQPTDDGGPREVHITNNIHPRENHDENTVATSVSRKLAFALRNL